MTETAPIRPRHVAAPLRLTPRPQALPFPAAIDAPEPEAPSAWTQPLPRVAAPPSPVARARGLVLRLPLGRASAQWGYGLLILAAMGLAVAPGVAASWDGDGARLQAQILALMDP